MSRVLHYKNLNVDENDVEKGIHELMSYVRPKWNVNDIKLQNFEEGITNKLVGCYVNGSEDMVIARMYGAKTDLIIDRKKEMQNMEILHRANLCPPLYCSFSNGLCYGFVDGVTLDAETVRMPHLQRLVAKQMVAMHSIPYDEINSVRGNEGQGKAVSALPRLLERFISIIPDKFDDPSRQQLFETRIPCRKDLEIEMDRLLEHIGHIESRIVFSHNDLLCKNLIYSSASDSVSFIDYEYGDYNYQFYDIGNHFCEYAGVEDVDYSRYPDRDTQMTFIGYYLQFWNERHCPGKMPSIDDMERVYCHSNKYALVANFMWGLWALIQAKYSAIDFDYLSYAVLRLDEYFAKRDAFFALPFMNEAV